MKKIFLTLLFFIMIASFVSCSFKGGKSVNDGYVMTIDGEKISVGEFSVYLYEQKTTFEEMGGSDIWVTDFNGVPASDVAKENAYNSIIYVKTACKNAESINVSLNDEDRAEAAGLAEETCGELGEEYCENVGLTLEKATSIMEEIVLHQKVMDYITRTYQLSDADYSAYIDSYIREHPDDKTPRATLESTLREDYIRSKKDEIYKSQIEKWNENIVIEKNNAVWDTISVADFDTAAEQTT